MVGMAAPEWSAVEVAEAVFAAEDELLAIGCGRIAFPFGEALVDQRHPAIYDVNSIRKVEGRPGLPQLDQAFADVITASGCRHRRIVARDPSAVRHLDEVLLPRGYARQACVAMALEGGAPARKLPRGLSAYLVDGSDEQLLRAVAHCQDLVRREELWYARDVSRQMDEMARRQIDEGGAEFVAAVDRHGVVGGALLLYCRDGVGFIADVGTSPQWRRRGVASALVCVASALARARGCRLVGLTARRDEDPRRMYERLGFQVVGESIDWLRSA